MSVTNTNPGTLFGGTWAQLKDRFLLGAGNTYSNGATGGNASHNHGLDDGYAKITRTWGSDSVYSKEKTVSSWLSDGRTYPLPSDTYGGPPTKAVELGGNTNNSSNMPPYLVVYMWKRTA